MHENKEIVRMLLNFFSLDGVFLESSESFDAWGILLGIYRASSNLFLFINGRNI